MRIQVDSLFKLTSSPSVLLLYPSCSLPRAPQLCSLSLTSMGSLSDPSKSQQLSIRLDTWVNTVVSGRGVTPEHSSFPTASLLLGQKTCPGGYAYMGDDDRLWWQSRVHSRGSLAKWRCIPERTSLFSIPLQCTSLSPPLLTSFESYQYDVVEKPQNKTSLLKNLPQVWSTNHMKGRKIFH